MALDRRKPEDIKTRYEARWNVEEVADGLAREKKLSAFISKLSIEEKRWLPEAVEDPDTLYVRERIP